MATSFQSCPGCESFILADTFECPECGHVFDEERSTAASDITQDVKTQNMYDACRRCGQSVRSGLVKCWNCNSFMRKDVEARYEQMQASPQRIIFSDVPADQRTELLEHRHDDRNAKSVFDAQDENDFDFTLRDGDTQDGTDDDDFELTPPMAQPSPAAKQVPSSPAVPKPPVAVTPTEKAAPTVETTKAAEAPASESRTTGDQSSDAEKPAAKINPEADKKKAPVDFDADDLVGIAFQDHKETQKRKKQKVEESRSKRILMPCTRCGAWIRVHQDQGGRTLRCRQCKVPFIVPMMKKKEKSSNAAKGKAAPQIDVSWLDDVRYHIVVPTAIVLKPGSMEKTSETVDLAFHESGLHVLKYAPPAKKSLFGKADGPPSVEEQRKQVREHVQKTGAIANLPFGELQTVDVDGLRKVRLVQPVAEAHESMFAGVPVFGSGRIALYLPLTLEDNKQALISLPISSYRKLADQLQKRFGTELNAKHNGVPVEDEVDTLKCNLSGMPVASLKHLEYYENDPAYEMELSGYQCGTCSIAVAEAARAQQKLGGPAGKGIAKAKCPGCQNKMGLNKLFKISKSPGDAADGASEEEDVSSVLTAPLPTSATAAKAASAGTALSASDLHGTWKMISLGRAGNFDSPDDMRSAGIEFVVDGQKYSVAAGGTVQEQGTLVLISSENPAHLDQQVTEGPDAGKSHLGLVRIVDGKLQNCQAAFGEPRPESFESRAGSSDTLAVFER